MKKILKLFAITSLLSISMTSAAFAGTWKQNTHGWWWLDGDKSYPSSTWKWIDSNGDGLAECYYFDENGYLLTGTTTPDGYTVNESGAWSEEGLVRQKAANPFASRTVNQEGLELYQEADQKSSGLPGLDIKADILMNLSYAGLEIPVSKNMQLKYHDINTPNMEFLSSTYTDMMGIHKSETSFYNNGCYYSDMGENEKFKMKIGYRDMTNNLTLGGLTGQFGAFLENVQIAADEDGNRVLLYSSQTEGLEQYLRNFYNEIWPSLADSDFRINQVNGKAVISPKGYFSKEVISIYMTMTEDEETMGISMNINLDYNNPGQPVAIQFPSTEGYEEIVY
ncbi:hypothetical protein [Clostridium sp. Marseille-P2415]|uniref:hypothetical protein n=1 Tax=Clostridium sp. Marseille-P2415 TaxID=1805471 RepID=UPI0009886548|nr:hypothetical protein [Clostridium sp. Marseille-P2415]